MKKKAFQELKARQHTRRYQRDYTRVMKRGVLRINLESLDLTDFIKLRKEFFVQQGMTVDLSHSKNQHGLGVEAFAEKLLANRVSVDPEEAAAAFMRAPYKQFASTPGERMTRAERKRAATRIQNHLRVEKVTATIAQICTVLERYLPYKPTPLKSGLPRGVILPFGVATGKDTWLRTLTLIAVRWISVKAGVPVFPSTSKGSFYYSSGREFILPAKF